MDEALFPLAYLLRAERVEKNIHTFIQICAEATPEAFPANLKKQFLQANYNTFDSPMTVTDDSLTILFEKDSTFEYYTSMLPPDIRNIVRTEIANPYTDAERHLVCENVQNALDHIQKTMPDLFQSLYYFLSRIYFFPSKTLYSGSKSPKCMGVILLCPDNLNDHNIYVETIVHEALHQLICLDNILHHIYDDSAISIQAAESGLSGAMSLKPLNFPATMESLVISATNQYLHILSNNTEQADFLATSYVIALEKLNAFIERMKSQDRHALTKNGYFWYQALNSIDWEKIHEVSGTAAKAKDVESLAFAMAE